MSKKAYVVSSGEMILIFSLLLYLPSSASGLLGLPAYGVFQTNADFLPKIHVRENISTEKMRENG